MLLRIMALALIIPVLTGAASIKTPATVGATRPDPLQPVRVYTFPDDCNVYYDHEKSGARFKFAVDDTHATFRIDAATTFGWGPQVFTPSALYPDFVSAYEAYREAPNARRITPSLELVSNPGKAFDDRMVATVETRLEKASERLPHGRQGFFVSLAQELANVELTEFVLPSRESDFEEAYENAAAFIATGIALGSADGKVPDAAGLPPEIVERAEKQARIYLEEYPEKSRPLGFYNWNKELQRLWARDKWYQSHLDVRNEDELAVAIALTAVISNNPTLQKQYDYLVAFGATLTNPPKYRNCNGVNARVKTTSVPIDETSVVYPERIQTPLLSDTSTYKPWAFCFLPPAATLEGLVYESIVAGRKDDLVFSRYFIEAIKKGALTLTPRPESGWYQYQQFAAEVLLRPETVPEGRKLYLTDEYRERLERAALTILTQARETHLKNIGVPWGARAPTNIIISVEPELCVEPFPTYYLRVARGYGFIRRALTNYLTKASLEDVTGVNESGSSRTNLDQELADIQELYYGLYLESCMEIGLAPEIAPDEIGDKEKAISRAQDWLNDWRADPVMARDIRIIVPVGYGETPSHEPYLNCWAITGVRAELIRTYYSDPPECRIVEGRIEEGEGPGQVQFEFPTGTSEYDVILVPETIDVKIPGTVPMTRDEFRALCDLHETSPDIKTALENRKPEGRKEEDIYTGVRSLFTGKPQ
ncbi:MAG: hypothetical protein V3W11_08435 [bacterium]